MITFDFILSVLIVHWLFDFVLQSEEMGKGKSKNNMILLHHVGIYSIGLFVIYFSFWPPNSSGLLWFITNAVLHFITDYLTSRASSAMYKEERYHEFFTIIGLDQTIHYSTLFGTYLLFK